VTRRASKVRPYDQNLHADKDALRENVAVWLRRKGDSGSPETVREAIENVTGVFRILQEWEMASSIQPCTEFSSEPHKTLPPDRADAHSRRSPLNAVSLGAP